jgi:hypothetical protein
MTTANRFASDYYEDNLTITGSAYTNSSGVEIVEGTDDYTIDLTGNALVGPLVATVLPAINTKVNGFTYRPLTSSVINAPYLWPMDVVGFTDKNGNTYSSALTNVAYGLNGATALESKGMTYAINAKTQPSGVTKEQAQLITEAMKQVETDIDESLTQQEIFNRLTDNGAAQGMVLYNGQLYVNATYINAGEMSADRISGGTLTLGGNNDANGTITIKRADGTEVGWIDKRGFLSYDPSEDVYASIAEGSMNFSVPAGGSRTQVGTFWFEYDPDDGIHKTTLQAYDGVNGIPGQLRLVIPTKARIVMDSIDGITAYLSQGLKMAITGPGGDLTVAGGLTLGTALTIANGGTGANNAADARTNLGAQQDMGFYIDQQGYICQRIGSDA